MAGLLHDLVDTDIHASKLGRAIIIPDPNVQWLCEHHHSASERAINPDLQLLTEADSRTSRYARILQRPTFRRKSKPVDTHDLARILEHAAQQSIYKLYSTMYHSEPLDRLFASKRHPTETLRRHLVSVANWVLFLLRTRISSQTASAALAGKPGVTPGPVEMEDPLTNDDPFDLW